MAKSDPRRELDRLILEKGETYASVSRLLGRNASYIQQFMKRGSPVNLDSSDIAQLALHFDVPPLLFGGASPPEVTRRSPITVPILRADYSVANNDRSRLMDEAWLRKLTDRPGGVAIIEIEGDAMQPTLRDGDEVIIQRRRAQESIRDGLFAIGGSAKVSVRRIAIEPSNNRISVITDHPSHPNWNGVLQRSVAIIGRVIWIGYRPG